MKTDKLKTWHLHVSGQVQGIGYRPLVFNIAKRAGIKGWVKNDRDGLHVKFNTTEKLALEFKQEITLHSAPVNVRITQVALSNISFAEFDDFEILHDDTAEETNLLITPDIALCNECKADISNKDERRYNYPFTSCSQCGPRYSIIEKLPYDRENTSMDSFKLCEECSIEYTNPAERRYYAQTNSCPTCGVDMHLYNSSKELISQDTSDIIKRIVSLWQEGKIVAIKGIGGYLLTCDAHNVKTVKLLRERKKRPSKPFALMIPNTDHLNGFAVSEVELSTLEDHTSPIMLLSSKGDQPYHEDIADGLDRIGVMLPYAPIFKILLDIFKNPIIATSANVSNAGIIYKDEDARTALLDIADYLVSNDRSIVIPQDDSVITITPKEKHKIIYRRSRGLAPTFINSRTTWPSQTILAMGAQLKSTFSLLHKGNVYISQYLGDLDHYESLNNFQVVQNHLINLLNAKPDVVVMDKHPSYQSSILGVNLSTNHGYKTHYVQHHEAHFSAVIGEHDLLDDSEPILGVVWDGLGLGNDGNLWGGEFYIYHDHQFNRCHHLPYFTLISNDKMAKEPRLSALSLCHEIQEAKNLLQEKFTPQEWKIYSKLLKVDKQLQTSSIGRLFDAVASLLGVMDIQTYEGEAAMQLEVLARKYFNENEYREVPSYEPPQLSYEKFSTMNLVSCILNDISSGLATDLIAAKFHGSLVKWIEAIAEKERCSKIAFSGGVFQNALLVDLIISYLKNRYKLYFHEQLSPNDENISFGQLINYEIANKAIKKA